MALQAQPQTLDFSKLLQPVQQDPALTQAYQALIAQESQPVQYQPPTQPTDVMNAISAAYSKPQAPQAGTNTAGTNTPEKPSNDVLGAIGAGIGGLANYANTSTGQGIMSLLASNPYYKQAWAQQAQGTKGLEMGRMSAAVEAEKGRREQLGALIPKLQEQQTAAGTAINTSRSNFVSALQKNQQFSLDEKKLIFDTEDAQAKNILAANSQNLTAAQQQIDALHNKTQSLMDATKDMRPDERAAFLSEYNRTGEIPEVLRKGFHPLAGYTVQGSASGSPGARVGATGATDWTQTRVAGGQ